MPHQAWLLLYFAWPETPEIVDYPVKMQAIWEGQGGQ
jgi:hypothetical protein